MLKFRFKIFSQTKIQISNISLNKIKIDLFKKLYLFRTEFEKPVGFSRDFTNLHSIPYQKKIGRNFLRSTFFFRKKNAPRCNLLHRGIEKAFYKWSTF